MKLPLKIWLIPLFTLLLAISIPKGYCEIQVNLHPSKGTVFTDILLEAHVPANSSSNILWDGELVVAFNMPHGEEHSPLSLIIKCPNQHPYSDLGNHTITVKSFYWNGTTKADSGNATFEIVEYFPCDEWLALNATYHELLANYSDLLNDFNVVQSDYNTLQTTYDSLSSEYAALQSSYESLNSTHSSVLNEYSQLQSDYSSLLANYTDLQSEYGSLLADYTDLQSEWDGLHRNYSSIGGDLSALQELYSSLLANYTDLQSDYDSMCSNYHALEADYNSLTSSTHALNLEYISLKSKHDTLKSDYGTTGILSYIFIVTTIIFITTSAYLAKRKPRTEPSAA